MTPISIMTMLRRKMGGESHNSIGLLARQRVRLQHVCHPQSHSDRARPGELRHLSKCRIPIISTNWHWDRPGQSQFLKILFAVCFWFNAQRSSPYNLIPKVHWQELLFRGVGGWEDIWGIVPSGGGETFAFQMIILAQFLDIWSPGDNILQLGKFSDFTWAALSKTCFSPWTLLSNWQNKFTFVSNWQKHVFRVHSLTSTISASSNL